MIKKGFIWYLVFIILLTGCTKRNMIQSNDLDDYKFTRWECSEKKLSIFVEGKYITTSGIARYEGDDDLYWATFKGRSLFGSTFYIYNTRTNERWSYKDEKVFDKNKKWTGEIRAFNDEESFIFKPYPLSQSEINLAYFICTSFTNRDASIVFYGEDDPYLIGDRYYWHYDNGDKHVQLEFGDERSFLMVENDKKAEGTYVASFESAVLHFDTNEIFDDLLELELFYHKVLLWDMK